MKISFTKMHGCGNDYIYVNGFTEKLSQEDKPEFVRKMSDRHFGIGGDGVIFINPPSEESAQQVDCEMEMYNADGSRGEMCGNGIRCVAKYVYEKGLSDKTQLCIESAGSRKYLTLTVEDGCVKKVRVDMGEPILSPEKIPVVSSGERVVAEEIEVEGKVWKMTCVSMGNPHAVVFVDDVAGLDLEKTGPGFEHHARFPRRINTEFARVTDRGHVEMRVWERGSGETLACGTGCCATLAACVLNGLTDRKAVISVLGGELETEWDEATGHIFMTGPAETVFEGVVDYVQP